MISGRHRLLGSFVIIEALIGTAIGDVRAQVSEPNSWTTVAPLPKGLLWPSVASAAGKLYVFGGLGSPGFVTTFEAYDPQKNAWTPMGNMPENLSGLPSATTGPDGLIYLYGFSQRGGSAVMVVYHPGANTWSQAPPPPGIVEGAILVTGRDGRIYAVGGTKNGNVAGTVGTLSAYNLHTHTWTTLAPDPMPRSQPGVSVGPDGRIYVIGGDATSTKLQAVEAYDPQRNAWASVASLPTPRFLLQAVTGPDGRIYALGGEGRCFTAPCNEVEAYDVHANTWTSVAPMPRGRSQFVAAVGPDGRIYVLGGFTTPYEVMPGSLPTRVDAYTVVPGNQPLPAPPSGPTVATRELAPMPTGRFGLGAATSGGKIYAIGGQAVVAPQLGAKQPPAPTVFRMVEAYDPTTNTWAQESPLPAPRLWMGVAAGPDGRIYVLGGLAASPRNVGGYTNIAGSRTVYIYDPRTRRWSRGMPMPDGGFALAAVTGADGRIYTIGGATTCHSDALSVAGIVPYARSARRPAQVPVGPAPIVPGGDCTATNTVRAFDPRTNRWTTLAPLRVGRILPAAAVGPDGHIYVFGGDPPPSSSFEAYDPGKNRWTKFTGLPHWHDNGAAAAAAQDGHIDLIGGCLFAPLGRGRAALYCGDPGRVDAYDPRTNKWTSIGVTLNARQEPAATTGPDGQVYAVGGAGYGNGKLLEVIRQGSSGGSSNR